MASLDELTLWWCKNGHWLATAFSTLKILMADTPNRGAVDANNAGLCSAEFPDALGKADTVPWRKKDRWRCKQQHYHTSWNLLAMHCLIVHRRIQPWWNHRSVLSAWAGLPRPSFSLQWTALKGALNSNGSFCQVFSQDNSETIWNCLYWILTLPTFCHLDVMCILLSSPPLPVGPWFCRRLPAS